MKIPDVFILERKNLDKKLKELETGMPSEIRQIKDLFSLSNIPEKIRGYDLWRDFKILKKNEWEWHLGEEVPPYIIQAGEMRYKQPSSPVFTSIYILEFKSTELKNLVVNLEKEINQYDATRTRCLKKESYLVAIKTNHTDEYSLDVFGNWYLNNFGLETL